MLKKTLILAVCFSLVFPVNVLLAAPSGGQVVQGQAHINHTGATTTINQSSNRAIVNWQNFDIAKNELVQHNMPSANAAALHRVIGGGGASQLAGELKSNGNIFLVNPAGVVIHQGARINTGGFMATTHDIANEDFMQGNYLFNKPGQPGASILNQGNITVRDQGFAALVAPMVRNEGVIAARLGKVALASGDAFKLDFYGDDLITFTVPESTVDRLHTTDGTPLGVENTGSIKAEGGVVLLSATQLDGVVSSVVNNGGTVSAASAELKGGRIVFSGAGEKVDVVNTGTVTASSGTGDGGTVRMTADAKVKVSGTVEAKGAKKGGRIDVSGKKETVVTAAKISTEGKEGGLVRLGGEFQGGNITADAEMRQEFLDRFHALEVMKSSGNLYVDTASRVAAGSDGTLVAWSDGLTDLAGIFSGKYVETSGRQIKVPSNLDITPGGMWLLDPDEITITNATGDNVNFINAQTLESQLGNTNVILEASNYIKFLNGVNIDAGSSVYSSLLLKTDNLIFEDCVSLIVQKLDKNYYDLFNFEQYLTIGNNVYIETKGYMDFGPLRYVSILSNTNIVAGSNFSTGSSSGHFTSSSFYLGKNSSITTKERVSLGQETITLEGASIVSGTSFGTTAYNIELHSIDDVYSKIYSQKDISLSQLMTLDIHKSDALTSIWAGDYLDIVFSHVGDGIVIPKGTKECPTIKVGGYDGAAITGNNRLRLSFYNRTLTLNAFSVEAPRIIQELPQDNAYLLGSAAGSVSEPHVFGLLNEAAQNDFLALPIFDASHPVYSALASEYDSLGPAPDPDPTPDPDPVTPLDPAPGTDPGTGTAPGTDPSKKPSHDLGDLPKDPDRKIEGGGDDGGGSAITDPVIGDDEPKEPVVPMPPLTIDEMNAKARQDLIDTAQLLTPKELLEKSPEITKDYAESVIDYAMLAALSYDIADTTYWPEGVYLFSELNARDVINEGNVKLGFDAHCFYNENTNEIIITYTGTNGKDDIVDWISDLNILLNVFGKNSQFIKAAAFYNAVLENPRVAKLIAEKNASVVLTGHSLGGGLAQAVGAGVGKEVYAFNPAPVSKKISTQKNNDNVHIIRTQFDELTTASALGGQAVAYESNDYVTIPGPFGIAQHGMTDLINGLMTVSGKTLSTEDKVKLYAEHYFFQ